eukprot:56409_1
MAQQLTPEQQEAFAKWKRMRSEVQQLQSKIGELDSQRNEHSLVLRTIEKMDPDRTCYRMIGGVLVKQTVKEVIPQVKKTEEGLGETITKLSETIKKTDTTIRDYERAHGIMVQGTPEFSEYQEKLAGDKNQTEEKKTGGSSGVLV